MNNFQPAKRLDEVPEYVFARLKKMAAEVEQRSKRKVLDFGAGSPDIPPSRIYTDKLAELVTGIDAHLYPGYYAIPEFATAIQQWYKQRFEVSLNTNELLPLNGAKDGISHLPLALFNEGDEVLMPNPGYPAFNEPSFLAGAKPIFYDLSITNNFKLELEAIRNKVSSRTKYMWVNFPSNPTGQIATLDELKELKAFAKETGIYILYDNAYAEITYGRIKAPSILQVEGAKDIAVEFGSFSKAYSFAGFRMGWVVGNAQVIAALAKLKTQMDSGMSLPLQHLGAYALTHPDSEWQSQMLASYQKRRDIIAEHLKSLGLEFELPKGGLYIWAKIPDNVLNSEEFCQQLLVQKQILLVPGSAYGSNGERYVRASICVNIDHIEEYF